MEQQANLGRLPPGASFYFYERVGEQVHRHEGTVVTREGNEVIISYKGSELGLSPNRIVYLDIGIGGSYNWGAHSSKDRMHQSPQYHERESTLLK